MEHPHKPRSGQPPEDPGKDMTQQTFDRMASVVSANECTGLSPAGLDEDEVRLLGELGGPPPPS